MDDTSISACTGFYVGKKVSADGSVIIARCIDHSDIPVGYRMVVNPRVENKPGRIHTGLCGFAWPLPPTTWKFISTPALTANGRGEFASACINEKGLAITGTVTGYVSKIINDAFPATKHGCAEENLPSLLAKCCATAREAVDLVGQVMAKLGTREANIYMVADQKEAWLIETYTANLWAAKRLPDDVVSGFGNQFVLDDYDAAAPDIESAPKEKGLAVYTADGKFDLFHTYSSRRYDYPNWRNWGAKRLLAPGTEGVYTRAAEFPLFYAPNRKIGTKDIFELFRTRYEGTDLCPEENERDDMRVIGTEAQASCHVLSVRDDIPAERAAVMWVAQGPAEHCVFLPVANNVTAVDESFSRDTSDSNRASADMETACDAFRKLAGLCEMDRKLYGKGVREYWKAREEELLAAWQPVFERGDASEITTFTVREQARAFNDAKRLCEETSWQMVRNGLSIRYIQIYGAPVRLPERKPFEASDSIAARHAPHACDPCIEVADNATKAVKAAAAEFAKYWELVTDRKLPEVSALTVKLVVDPSLDAAHDEYRITSTDNGLTISGANGRAVIYAVYDFFERQAGCRWFWDGDKVPKSETLSLANLNVSEKARFEYRGLRYFAHRGLTRFQAEHWGIEDWKKEIDWCLKRRLNCFMPRIGMDDTWQKAYPDIVPYPDPKDPIGDNLRGYDNRVSFWGLKYRGELRKMFTEYAFDRGMIIPTDFGTMTHWYARTPVEFLEKKNPPFLPQANNNYNQRTGLVWDIFQGEWLDDYWHLTEAFIDAGYGKPDFLHTIGLGERMCFNDRAKNLQMKKDVLAKITGKALSAYPDSKILLAGWDFYCTWKNEEVQSLIPKLDPKNTIIWDYECDAESETDGSKPGTCSNFTKWGVVGKFPYTFGIFLALEQGLDIRAHYNLIEEREKLILNDPFCKGYIFWPESSHTDIFLLRYFTANSWKPGQTHDKLLPEFCKDRYGDKAAAFEAIWQKVIPLSMILGWWYNWGSELIDWNNHYISWRDLDKDFELLKPVPEIFARLSEIVPEDNFQRRDVIDLARTTVDRMLIAAHGSLTRAYNGWCEGKVADAKVAIIAEAYLKLIAAATEILALHTDYSLCDSLDRLNVAKTGYAPDFGKILLDNASNGYCRSHQYEVAAGWYKPFANDCVAEMIKHVEDGNKTPIDPELIGKIRGEHFNELESKGIEAYRPTLPRTVREYRRVIGNAREASAAILASRL